MTSALAAVLFAMPLAAMADVSIGAGATSARFESSDFDGDDTGWKAFIGAGFGELLGAEIGYHDFGQLGGSGGPDAKATTVAATLGFPLPFATPFGKIGWAFQDVEGTPTTEEIDDEEVFYGVGLSFGAPAMPVAFRLEYERFQLDDDDLDVASLSLALRF